MKFPLLIQKFGGTSVGTIERIRAVASWVVDHHQKGHPVVVVVSAMSGETNRLVELAHQINPIPFSSAYDLLIASGEQVSVGLVTLAINAEAARRGLSSNEIACGLLAHQIGIRTDKVYSKARIEAIDTARLKRELENHRVCVIAGFQGVDSDNNITTLGRGGSDTSAVAIAAALKPLYPSLDCEIYTDVDGVYTTDPRIEPRARRLPEITHEEMMELAGLGAKVLQIRSVELAANYDVPLVVRSSLEIEKGISGPGTRIVSQRSHAARAEGAKNSMENAKMEKVVVSGVALDRDQIKFSLQSLKDRPGVAAEIFGALARAAIVVDVIVQAISREGFITISFTVGKADQLKAEKTLGELKSRPGYETLEVSVEPGLSKVSIVGVGMQNHPGVASKMFELLGSAGINIALITTSEIKVSCLVAGSQGDAAVRALHEGFRLHEVG